MAFHWWFTHIHSIDPNNLTAGWTVIQNAKHPSHQVTMIAAVKPGLNVLVGVSDLNHSVVVSQTLNMDTFGDTIFTKGITPMRNFAMTSVKIDYFECDCCN